jgi:uncharacterized protein YoaH (UPF0181 family)
MNMKDAAFAVAQTIRKYHQLEALERCIQQAEQHLKTVSAFSEQQQQAVISLMNLRSSGIKESEVIELINVARFAKQYYNAGTGSSSSSNGNKFKLGSGF